MNRDNVICEDFVKMRNELARLVSIIYNKSISPIAGNEYAKIVPPHCEIILAYIEGKFSDHKGYRIWIYNNMLESGEYMPHPSAIKDKITGLPLLIKKSKWEEMGREAFDKKYGFSK